MVQSLIQNSVRRILKTRAALHQPSRYLLTGSVHFHRHARPGQAPLPCTIYPLSASSVGAWAILYMRVCHASASIKLRLLAWEMQQPPVNHLFCCSIFFFLFFFPFNSREAHVSFGETTFLVFLAFYKEKWFLEEVTSLCMFQ